MEIQNGEYIRTKDGYIGKVTRFTTSDICYVKFYDNEEWKTDIEEAGIVKHSFNIAEILEEDDYVNGMRVSYVRFPNDPYEPTEIYVLDKHINFIFASDIKSVVTHEQMKAMEYVIEEG